MRENQLGWYVLYVKTRHEKKINELLQESGVESFLPVVTNLHQWSDRKKKIQKPLFPCYIFVNIQSKNDFFRALNVRGVYKYLCFGDEYAKVKEDEISRVKQLLGLKGVSDVNVVNVIPTVGSKMKVNSGLLKGIECTVILSKNKNKIFVRIDSLRQNIEASVPIEILSYCQT